VMQVVRQQAVVRLCQLAVVVVAVVEAVPDE
jgi:hypothetical protein